MNAEIYKLHLVFEDYPTNVPYSKRESYNAEFSYPVSNPY